MSKAVFIALSLLFVAVLFQPAPAQVNRTFAVVQDKAELERIVPGSFYFAGLSGPTQRRNSAVATIGETRHIVAGLVDVSGYSTDISGVYEGFFITDSDIRIAGRKIPVGAYGFGFAKDQKMNLFDLSGKKILTVETSRDKEMRRPRPLMMVAVDGGIKFYKGRDYVLLQD